MSTTVLACTFVDKINASAKAICLNKLMSIKCIAFDLDNTLWECDPLIIRAEQKFYEWLDSSYPKITQKYNNDQLVAHRMSFMKARPDQHHDLTTLRKDWMRQLAKEFAMDDEFVEPGFKTFLRYRNQVTFYEGALDMLENLSKQYSLGVISNGNADVHQIGIGHYFDFVTSSEAAGVAKPDEAIFHHAMGLSNNDMSETVYVGDDPVRDVLGAQQVGMKAIWYNPSLSPWPGGKSPAAVIRHHNELEDKIKQL